LRLAPKLKFFVFGAKIKTNFAFGAKIKVSATNVRQVAEESSVQWPFCVVSHFRACAVLVCHNL
jgi:hypothetical protein